MDKKEYIVTVHNKEDLCDIYDEMECHHCACTAKRPLSRNTHFLLSEEEVERLRNDPRIWGVELVESFHIKAQVYTNLQSYQISGNFWKDDTQAPSTISPTDRQWGHLHCAGNSSQRGSGSYGSIAGGGTYEIVNETIDIYNDGKNADIIIVDDPISYDSEEWISPTTSTSRFVQYQWFNELNSIVAGIDDDGQALPTGTITYETNANTPEFHGIHVAGTAAGQHYGWAREANIYNLAVTASWPSGQIIPALLIFDYIRAFHANKPVNPITGRRNPTITNHSYAYVYLMPNDNLTFADVNSVIYQGITYNSGNPGPSGWNEAGLETDFGLRFGLAAMPQWSPSIIADVQDAIEEGIVVIGAAGNDNLMIAETNDVNWNNRVDISGVGTIYYNRGGAPNTPESGSIIVGAISASHNFDPASFSNYGPAIDVFAPGQNIASSFGNTGLVDGKYAAGNYFYPINGTSMASPQVAGAAALLATNKIRLTNADVRNYLNNTSVENGMSNLQANTPNKFLHVKKDINKTIGIRQPVGQVYPRTSIVYSN